MNPEESISTDMKKVGISTRVESRIIRIKLADGSVITGQVNLNRDLNNEYERLSDLLTKNSEQFLVVFSATEIRYDLDEVIKHNVIFINRQYILWAIPEENQQ